MVKVKLYPTKIEQPNKNQSSGLAGVHFQEIRRDGKVHIKNLRDLNDPKYHHQWSNTSNLKEGKTAQCGHKSSYHCSHKTYYSIKGYRNTCPIAGVTGTYTQPATLSLYFSPESKNIYANSIINSVTLTFKHRCVGVDVATDKIYTNWGPNFSGFSKYPSRKVLTVKFGGETLTYNTNPPLSGDKYTSVSFTFKNVSYNDLKNKSINIIYGNNLSTNPGNIYITGLSIEVDHTPGVPYIEGKADTDVIYLSDEDECESHINFTLEAGYQSNGEKLSVSRAPKNLQKSVVLQEAPKSCNIPLYIDPNNKKIVHAVLTDNSNVAGEKIVRFKLKENGKIVSFKYKAVIRNKPDIIIPERIEKNIRSLSPIIIANNGCTKKITIYDGGINGPSIQLTTDINNKENLVPQSEQNRFEQWLSRLSCGKHTLFIRRGNDGNDKLLQHDIIISPTKHNFTYTYIEDNNEFSFVSLTRNQDKKTPSLPIKITLEKRNYINAPKFIIINPTYQRLREPIGNTSWNVGSEGYVKSTNLGLYRFGDFTITIRDENNCPEEQDKSFNISIKSTHKQRFDRLFVRGEDSSAFNYNYIVALEGDDIRKPVYPTNIQTGASFEDIKICSQPYTQARLSEVQFVELNITNNKTETINNLLLELNTLTTNNEGVYTVTTDEWIEEDGIFKNIQEQFLAYNSNIIDRVTIKNLSLDDDSVDEEDVYLSISKLEAKSTLTVKIPYQSHVERDVDLQILLFGEPMQIYSINNCSKETESFSKINLRVYDSIATSMSIEGDIDIQTPNETKCGVSCYNTEEGVKYKIKNIDTRSIDSTVTTIIKNDPRLVAYKILDKNGKENYQILDENDNYIEVNNPSYVNNTNTKKQSKVILRNAKISTTVKFENYNEEILDGYTNSDGIVTFYVKIPSSINKQFTSDKLAAVCKNISSTITQVSAEVINTPFIYKPGQTVPLQFKIFYTQSKYVSEIIFYANIKNPGDSDEITVFYRACNLPNDEGILKTTFKTATEDEVLNSNSYQVIPNEVSKNLLFGIKTDLDLYTRLEKIIVENHTINRLHLRLINKKRFNKDVNIVFNENKEDTSKTGRYKYVNSKVENGIITNNDGVIYWNIPYIEEDTIITGFIDFEADKVGINEIDISITDFLNEG